MAKDDLSQGLNPKAAVSAAGGASGMSAAGHSAAGLPAGLLATTTPEQAMIAALRDGRIPSIYGNSYSAFIGSHDLGVMFGVNGVPVGFLNLTYPLAKALGKGLLDAI